MDSQIKPITFLNRKGLKLFGILHTPPQPRRDVGIIILSPGIKSRVAPHRLYVKMAKRFCEMGFCVLRFDPHGIGDSEGEIEERMAADFYASVQVGRFVNDTIDAMDWMERKCRISSFILTGLCGGAITGLLAGAMDQRVHSLLGLGIPVILDSASTDKTKYMTRGQLEELRDGYLRKLLDIKSWTRFLSMKSDYRLIYKSTLRLPGPKAWACSGLTLSRVFLLRLKRWGLPSTRGQAEGAQPNGSILTTVKGKAGHSHTAHPLPRRERDGVRVKSTHSTFRSDPSNALRTSARGTLRVDTEQRFLPRFENRGLPSTRAQAEGSPSNVSNESDNNFNPYFPLALHNMLSSRKVLLIFSGADRLHWEFEEKYIQNYAQEFQKLSKNIDIHVIQNANHILSFTEWQDEMLDKVASALESLVA